MKKENSKIALENYSSEIYSMLQALGLESEVALTLLHNHRREIEQWFPRETGSRRSTPIVTAAMAARILKAKYF